MTDDSKATAGITNLWALIVGINDYATESVNDLTGCVNDANGLKTFLTDRLGVPEAQIKTLTDGEATRAAILATFQNFLVDNPDIPRGSQLLFTYSGHGSQMRTADPLEMDGYDETILPHDARTTDSATGQRIYDIPDKTLGGLIDRLAAAKGDNITVILDCCHSGSGTRDPLSAAAEGVRRAAPDETVAPADLDAELRARPMARGGTSGWAAGRENHVLLAGCRDGESSYEYTSSAGRYGALTYFLLQELQNLGPNTTYADLHERVASRVNGVYRAQLPQCEGDRERVVFGGARLRRDPFITVGAVAGEQVTLQAGLIHGLAAGARLAAYPPEVRTLEQAAGDPLARLTVTDVRATTATAQVEPTAGGTRPAVPVHARAIVTERAYEGSDQTVALVVDDATLARAVTMLDAAIARSSYLQSVSDVSAAQLRVQAAGGALRILDAGGELLVSPAATGADVDKTLAALESIARFRALSALGNRSATAVQGKVRLALRRFQTGAEPKDMPLVTPDAGGQTTLPWRPDRPDAADDNRYLLEVRNDSPLPLYPHVFFLGSDFGITRLYPRQGETVAIPAGAVGYPRRLAGALFKVFLNPDEAASRDTLQVILTAEPTDLAVLQQPALAVPTAAERTTRGALGGLAAVVDAFGGGRGTRGAVPDEPDAGDDWGVAQMTFDVVRTAIAVDLSADREAVDLGDGLTLRKPRGFTGSAAVITQVAATRGAEGAGLRPPPALAQPSAGLPPLALTAARGGGSSGLVLELEADPVARAAVSEAAPLVLELPAGTVTGGEEVLAVAFDGQDYLLVGGGSGDEVRIHSVPEPVAPAAPDQAGASGPPGAPSTRDASNLVRFFFYKKLGRTSADLGLRRVVLENGKLKRDAEGWPVYDPRRPAPADFAAGQAVALIVHGFSDDTRGLAGALVDRLRRGVRAYDHILTFDYETFGTSAATTGDELARALREQCGLNRDDGIAVHVFAHSMGCLVTRCLVERSGGHELVDAAVLAGPPNRGTPAANASRGVAYLAAALLGQLAVVTPVGLLALPVAWMAAEGHGWADLMVDSELTREINAQTAPDNVKYLVLAGYNEVGGAAEERWQRLAKKTLGDELLFDEPNDGVIGESSMKGLRGGHYPALAVETLTCDHFTYYSSGTMGVIRGWLG